LQHVVQRVYHLAQVVGRDAGGHTDCDPGGAVDQQVGEGSRKHVRLGERAVEVLDKVNRVLSDV
jgi:hypothetical protein